MDTKRTFDIIILVLLSIIWGSSYLLTKKALYDLSPVMVATARVLISGMIFLPYLWTIRDKITLSIKHSFYYFLVGFVGTAMPSFLFAFSINETDSAVAGILNALTPVFTLLISLLVFNYKPSISKISGIAIAFIGTALLVYLSNSNGTQKIETIPFLMIIMATICYAISSNVVKYRLSNVHPLIISGMGFGIAIGPTFLTSVSLESHHITEYINFSLFYVAILAIFSTVIASALYFWLVQRTDAVFASSVSFLIPAVAVILGFLDGELIDWTKIVGMVIILLGVRLIQKK